MAAAVTCQPMLRRTGAQLDGKYSYNQICVVPKEKTHTENNNMYMHSQASTHRRPTCDSRSNAKGKHENNQTATDLTARAPVRRVQNDAHTAPQSEETMQANTELKPEGHVDSHESLAPEDLALEIAMAGEEITAGLASVDALTKEVLRHTCTDPVGDLPNCPRQNHFYKPLTRTASLSYTPDSRHLPPDVVAVPLKKEGSHGVYGSYDTAGLQGDNGSVKSGSGMFSFLLKPKFSSASRKAKNTLSTTSDISHGGSITSVGGMEWSTTSVGNTGYAPHHGADNNGHEDGLQFSNTHLPAGCTAKRRNSTASLYSTHSTISTGSMGSGVPHHLLSEPHPLNSKRRSNSLTRVFSEVVNAALNIGDYAVDVACDAVTSAKPHQPKHVHSGTLAPPTTLPSIPAESRDCDSQPLTRTKSHSDIETSLAGGRSNGERTGSDGHHSAFGELRSTLRRSFTAKVDSATGRKELLRDRARRGSTNAAESPSLDFSPKSEGAGSSRSKNSGGPSIITATPSNGDLEYDGISLHTSRDAMARLGPSAGSNSKIHLQSPMNVLGRKSSAPEPTTGSHEGSQHDFPKCHSSPRLPAIQSYTPPTLQPVIQRNADLWDKVVQAKLSVNNQPGASGRRA